MKFFKKKADNSAPITTIVDRELNTYICEKEIEYVDKYLKYAQKLSVIKFNELDPTSRIKDYIKGLVLDFQKLVDYADQRLNGSVLLTKGIANINATNRDIQQLNQKIDESQDEINILKARLDSDAKKHKPKIKRWATLLWLPYSLTGFELLANIEIYNMLGGSIFSSISIAFISGIVVFWWAHLSGKFIHRFGNQNWRRQLLVSCILSLPIFIIFYLFSSMRIDYLMALSPDMQEVYTSSPLVPTLINGFAYLITTYLVFEYRPTTSIKNAYKRYCNDLQLINVLEKERDRNIQQKKNKEDDLSQKLSDYSNVFLLGKQIEQDISTRMLACFHEFKSELHLLTNGACSVLFSSDSEDVPPLKFNYQDANEQIFIS